jgi:DNA-binding NtrC family response regulator
MILENKEQLDLGDLPEELVHVSGGGDGAGAAAAGAAGDGGSDAAGLIVLPEGGISLRDMEREMVRQALERTEGNKTQAARLLRISRDALRYKMQKFGLPG